MLSPIYSLQELLPFPKRSANSANATKAVPALAEMNFGMPADEKPARRKRRSRPAKSAPSSR